MTPAEESALLEKYRPLVRTVARSVSREAARDEDALQCGFIGLWEAAERWDGRRPFAPLARRCIRCNIMDYLRGRPPPSEELPEDLPAPEPARSATRWSSAAASSDFRSTPALCCGRDSGRFPWPEWCRGPRESF